MKLLRSRVGLLLAFTLACVAATVTLLGLRDGTPDCDCYYPNTGNYGVSAGGGCAVKKCRVTGPIKSKDKIEIFYK
jgi:hypothetical protein